MVHQIGPAQVIQTQHPVTTAHVLTGPGPGGTMGQPQTLIVNNGVGARNGISLTPARPQQVRRFYNLRAFLPFLRINILTCILAVTLLSTLDGIRLGFKTLRIYISAHFVSTSFKVLNVC